MAAEQCAEGCCEIADGAAPDSAQDFVPVAEVVFATKGNGGLDNQVTIYLVKVTLENSTCFELKLGSGCSGEPIEDLAVQSSLCLPQTQGSAFKCVLPYHGIMIEILGVLSPGASELCTLGHGLGEAASSWQSRLASKGASLQKLTAVDNCCAVLELAQSLLHSLPDDISPMLAVTEYLEADAIQYLDGCKAASFDAIIVDIGASPWEYGKCTLLAPPPAVMEPAWLKAALQLLRAGGVLMINLLTAFEAGITPAAQAAKTLASAIPDAASAVYTCCSCEGHYPGQLNVLLVIRAGTAQNEFPGRISCETALKARVEANLF